MQGRKKFPALYWLIEAEYVTGLRSGCADCKKRRRGFDMTQEKMTAVAAIDAKAGVIGQAADHIWEYAELSLQEEKSAEYYCQVLEQEGFQVERGICGIDTAFSASFGSGRPVIGMLAEYDALSGLSQEAGLLEQKERVAGGCGHGCGHNLLGAGALAAALGVKAWLEQSGQDRKSVV